MKIHSAGEFVVHDPDRVRPPARTNAAESPHNDLRRSVLGVLRCLSEKQLDCYLREITWRRNHRNAGHLQRIAAVLACGVPPLTFVSLMA